MTVALPDGGTMIDQPRVPHHLARRESSARGWFPSAGRLGGLGSGCQARGNTVEIVVTCCRSRDFFSLPPCGGGPGWGVGSPAILGSSPIARPRPPHPGPPPQAGREIRVPDATGTYRIFNGIEARGAPQARATIRVMEQKTFEGTWEEIACRGDDCPTWPRPATAPCGRAKGSRNGPTRCDPSTRRSVRPATPCVSTSKSATSAPGSSRWPAPSRTRATDATSSGARSTSGWPRRGEKNYR